MKILLINKYCYLESGATRHIFDLEKVLKANGHEVVYFAMQDSKNIPEKTNKFFVSKLDFSKAKFNFNAFKKIGRMFYSLEAKKKMKELIQQEKPDIAHVHNIYHQISPSILPVLRKAGIPIVMTNHDYKLICPSYAMYSKRRVCEKCLKHKYYHAPLERCLKNSFFASLIVMFEMYFHKLLKIYEKNINLNIVPSEYVRGVFVKFGQDKNKIKVLPHFVDMLTNGEGDKKQDYILYAGRLSTEKGVAMLVNVFLKIKNNQSKLIIAGHGPLEDRLKEKVKKLGLEKNIEFLGQISKQEVIDKMKFAKAVVIPSQSAETFGLTCLEAIKLKTPVLASDIGGLSELKKHSKCVKLIDPYDKGKWQLEIENMCQNKVSSSCQINGNILTSQEYYLEIIKLYNELIETTKK